MASSRKTLRRAIAGSPQFANRRRLGTAGHSAAASSMVVLEQLAELFVRIVGSRLSAIPKLVLTEAGNFPDPLAASSTVALRLAKY